MYFGDRLKLFGASVVNQEELPLRPILAIAEMVIKFNPSLR